MFILAFSGLLRSSELCVIRNRDVQFNEGYVTGRIEKNKTDQLRGADRSLLLNPLLSRARARYLRLRLCELKLCL